MERNHVQKFVQSCEKNVIKLTTWLVVVVLNTHTEFRKNRVHFTFHTRKAER